jgi:hypothetical protein
MEHEMISKVRLITVFLSVFAAIGGSFSTSWAASVTLSNATTSLTINGGETNSGLIPYGGYFSYTDLGDAEETTWSINPLLVFSNGSTSNLSNGSTGGFGSPTDIGGGVVRSTSTTTDLISTQADTELIGSNAKTTFSFTDLSTNGLDGTTFVFYAENDIFSFANDTAAYTGSIAGDDLALFMFDTGLGGLSVKMTGEGVSNSSLSLFGAGIWTAWGTALEGGDLSVLSSDGSNFATVGDLGLALAFNLTGSSAELIINYDTQPNPPPMPAVPVPAAIWLFGTALIGFVGMSRRRKVA